MCFLSIPCRLPVVYCAVQYVAIRPTPSAVLPHIEYGNYFVRRSFSYAAMPPLLTQTLRCATMTLASRDADIFFSMGNTCLCRVTDSPSSDVASSMLLYSGVAAWYIISVVCACLSVCTYVCQMHDNFRKPWCRKFIFTPPVYRQDTEVRFVYEGHRVNVKVMGAKRSQMSVHALINFARQFSSVY